MSIINILAPVFILVGLGVLLKHSRLLSDVFFEECAKFTYWIALPALLFYKISYARFDLNTTWKISFAMISSSIIIALAAWGLSGILKLESSIKKTFIQTSFHCNTAFVGLPVIIYVFSSGLFGSEMLVDAATVALAPMIPAISILSIIVMCGGDNNMKRNNVLELLKNIYKNPLVIACLAGLFIYAFNFKFPVAITRGLDALVPVALPLALLSIGASLKLKIAKGDFAVALTAACLNVVILPFAGLASCYILGLSRGETLVALIFLACPTASSSYIYAQQLKGNAVFASQVIVISTIISVLPLLSILYFWRL